MEIKNFVKLASTALVLGCFASCQDYEPFDEATVAASVKAREFTDNFEARYGQIDPEHDWGFQDIIITAGPSADNGTRGAGDDLHDPTVPSQQHWVEYYGIVPPGAPDNWNTNSPWGQDWTGSVTAEEILFVSEFFRVYNKTNFDANSFTTNKPVGLESAENVSLHLTDFFVESISGDDDQSSYNTSSHGEGTPVYRQDGVSADITYGMDCLIARTMDSSDDYSTWHHVNNFNYGNTVHRPQQYADNSVNPYLPKDNEGHVALDLVNPTDEDVDKDIYGATKSKERNRTLMYVRSSGTESFAFHPSWDDQSSFYESYVLVRLSFTVNGHHYEGTYLAFDWQGKMGSDIARPDGYYNNWIIKITPVHFVPSPKFPVSRIFCEDLGNTFDFDFNDLVFDVKYEATYADGIPTNVEAILTIQASGGTLPIYVGENNAQHEAHFLLGQGSVTSKPVNVGGGGPSHEVAITRVGIPFSYTGNAHNTKIVVNPNDINIWVGGTTASLVSAPYLLPASGKGDNIAPQKISIPDNTTRWLAESQQIEWGYEHFDAWVKDQKSYDFYVWKADGSGYETEWDNSGNQVNKANPNAWNKIDINTSFLY